MSQRLGAVLGHPTLWSQGPCTALAACLWSRVPCTALAACFFTKDQSFGQYSLVYSGNTALGQYSPVGSSNTASGQYIPVGSSNTAVGQDIPVGSGKPSTSVPSSLTAVRAGQETPTQHSGQYCTVINGLAATGGPWTSHGGKRNALALSGGPWTSRGACSLSLSAAGLLGGTSLSSLPCPPGGLRTNNLRPPKGQRGYFTFMWNKDVPPPQIHHCGGLDVSELLEDCPVLLDPYTPFPDFSGDGHVETLVGALLRSVPALEYRRELLAIQEDGATIALDWDPQAQDLAEDAPLLVLIAGLTGGSTSTYVKHMVCIARAHGHRCVVVNHCGTADSPVTSPRLYSASYTGDFRCAVHHIHSLYPLAPVSAVGWSIGANILVHYLAEEGDKCTLVAAATLCNPYNLTMASINLTNGFRRLYDYHLATRMAGVFIKHKEMLCSPKMLASGLDSEGASNPWIVRQFDTACTIHQFGWSSADEYYINASSGPKMKDVRTPMLCINALDDPIAPKAAIPFEVFGRGGNPNLILVTTATGGHLGWMPLGRTKQVKRNPSHPCRRKQPDTEVLDSFYADGMLDGPWTDEVVLDFLEAVLKRKQKA